MTPFSLYADLEARGIVKQTTDPELARELDRAPITVYVGFDPTSDSLHLGSLLPLLTLRRFQMAGHTPIAVVGGATGMIGDPSGKTQERQLLTVENLEKNLEGIRRTMAKFLNSGGKNPVRIVNNHDWFKGVDYLTFLRDVGKHFTVNHMMAKESVRARLEDREHGISYTEFSYMLLQAYDFYVLHKKHGCRLQIGGSDQWGNITAGCELIRRMSAAHDEKAPEVFGLTHPLVMKADGSKFGKTEKGNIWLDPEKTSPYQFYQFFIQTSDEDVGTFLKFFTFLPMPEIMRLEEARRAAPEKREAQKALAQDLTRLVHGEAALQKAENAAQALFGTGIKDLDERTLKDVFADAPSTKIDKSRLSPGLSLLDLLAETGLCQSKGAARKDLTSGGIYVNNERIADPVAVLKAEHLIAGKFIVLRKGKKTYHLAAFH
jgi:tyrosyl-tRNA synthetase